MSDADNTKSIVSKIFSELPEDSVERFLEYFTTKTFQAGLQKDKA